MAFAPILMAVGTAMSAIGAIQQGNAAAANYQAQAMANKRNAKIMEMNAQATSAQAAQAEDAQRRKARQIGGMQRAAISESGTGDGGTNALLVEQSGRNAELDALNIRYEGELKRRGLLNEAGNERYAAKVNKMNAGQSRMAGYMGAGTSLLSAGAKYAGGAYGGGFGYYGNLGRIDWF